MAGWFQLFEGGQDQVLEGLARSGIRSERHGVQTLDQGAAFEGFNVIQVLKQMLNMGAKLVSIHHATH